MNDLRKEVEDALKEGEIYDQFGARWGEKRIDALRAALAQPDPFNPDWDRVKALEESLREHMAEIQRLKALAQPEQLIVGGGDLPTLTKWTPMSEGQLPKEDEQEPVAHRIFDGEGGYVFVDGDPSEFEVGWSARYRRKYEPLYTAPPQRKPLTDEQIAKIDWKDGETLHDFARAIEKAHGIGGEHE